MPMQISISNAIGGGGGSQGGGSTPTPPSFADTKSFQLDGLTDYFQGTSTYSELDGLYKATWSIWVKPINTGVDIIFHNPRNTTSQNSQFLLWIRAGNRIDFSLDATSKYMRGDISAITFGAWNHIMICVDFTQVLNADKGRIFVNGVDATTLVNIASNPQIFANASNSLHLGEDANGYQSPYGGNLDEFAIWAGTDQRANVSEIYNGGVPNDLNTLPTAPQPTTWFRMGENATWKGGQFIMTDVNGGYVNTSVGILPTDPNPTTDVPLFDNKSFTYDGSLDFVSMGNVLNMADDGTDAYSLSCWFKTTSTSTQMLIAKQLVGMPYNGFNLYLSDSGLRFYWILGTLTSSAYIAGTSIQNGTIRNGNWHHVCLTYDGSQDISGFELYYDGIPIVFTTASNNTPSAVSNTVDFMIGARGTSASSALRFNGNINDTSIFNTELTQEQVTEIYNGGIANDISSLNPLSYWRAEQVTFDGSNWTMIDQGSGANNGTSVSMPLTSRTSDVPT